MSEPFQVELPYMPEQPPKPVPTQVHVSAKPTTWDIVGGLRKLTVTLNRDDLSTFDMASNRRYATFVTTVAGHELQICVWVDGQDDE